MYSIITLKITFFLIKKVNFPSYYSNAEIHVHRNKEGLKEQDKMSTNWSIARLEFGMTTIYFGIKLTTNSIVFIR